MLTLLSDMSIKLILNLRELETLQGSESELKIERKRREEVEQDLQAVRLVRRVKLTNPFCTSKKLIQKQIRRIIY